MPWEDDRSMKLAARFCHRFVIYAAFRCLLQQWQAHFKARASTNGALHADLAAVRLDNPLHNSQAQACATGLFAFRSAALRQRFLPPRARLIYPIEALEIGRAHV